MCVKYECLLWAGLVSPVASVFQQTPCVHLNVPALVLLDSPSMDRTAVSLRYSSL